MGSEIIEQLNERFETVIDWCADHMPLIIGTMVLIMVVGLGGIFCLIILDSYSEVFTLRKEEWKCTQSHIEEVITYIEAGDVDIPVYTNITVCDQYTKQ